MRQRSESIAACLEKNESKSVAKMDIDKRHTLRHSTTHTHPFTMETQSTCNKRHMFLNASEIAALIGKNPYRSSTQAWLAFCRRCGVQSSPTPAAPPCGANGCTLTPHSASATDAEVISAILNQHNISLDDIIETSSSSSHHARVRQLSVNMALSTDESPSRAVLLSDSGLPLPSVSATTTATSTNADSGQTQQLCPLRVDDAFADCAFATSPIPGETSPLPLSPVHQQTSAAAATQPATCTVKDVTQAFIRSSTNVDSLNADQRSVLTLLKSQPHPLPDHELHQIEQSITNMMQTDFGTRNESAILDRVQMWSPPTVTGELHIPALRSRKLFETESLQWFVRGKADGIIYPDNVIVEVKNRVHRLFLSVREYENIQMIMYLFLYHASDGYLVEAIRRQFTDGSSHGKEDDVRTDHHVSPLSMNHTYFQNKICAPLERACQLFDESVQTRGRQLHMGGDGEWLERIEQLWLAPTKINPTAVTGSI